MKRLGVLGTFVWDTIRTREDAARGEAFESWGGIAYSLAAAAAVRPDGWEVVPVCRVGYDLEARAREFLATLPGVAVGPELRGVPEPNNRVELRYLDAARRDEHMSGGIGPWSWEELAPALEGLDALYVNFISGHELRLPDAERLRRAFPGPLYADLHSLFLGPPGRGARETRPLPEWERWAACFHTVQLNEHELGTIADASDPAAAAERVLGAGPERVLVTRGEDGAAYALRTDEGAVEHGTVPAPERHGGDPTGCGDVWGVAAFCGLLEGLPVEEAVRRAHVVAGRKMGHRGASTLYPHLSRPGSPGDRS